MHELWVKERGSRIGRASSFSPIELTESGYVRVLVGLMLVTDKPPGKVVGEYWYEDVQLRVKLTKKP